MSFERHTNTTYISKFVPSKAIELECVSTEMESPQVLMFLKNTGGVMEASDFHNQYKYICFRNSSALGEWNLRQANRP